MEKIFGNIFAAGDYQSAEGGIVLQDGLALGGLTTVGAGVLTAALLAGEYIARSGPTAAFSDTTDSAPNIIAALANANSPQNTPLGGSIRIRIINNTAYTQTILAGTGVTLSGTMTLATNTHRDFLLTITGANTVSLTNLGGGSN
jgi:hypothetical protein